MASFAGVAVLIVILVIGIGITIISIVGNIVYNNLKKRKGQRGRLWVRIILWVFIVFGVIIMTVPSQFLYMLISKNKQQEQQTVERKQQAIEESNTYDEEINTLDAFVESNDTTGYRLIVTDSTAGSKFYELEKTTDGGINWSAVNEDPFAGNLGKAEGITFFTEDYGYIGLSDASESCSELYVTYDGGSTFSRIELPMELVTTLPDHAIANGYTVSDYDYYDMPIEDTGVVSIKVTTDFMETRGLVFISEDEGVTWKLLDSE